ncbi:hypothetical protein ASD69_08630 [Lysobacter sp. Root604]|nr:hypothetical protein ASD69_08630 [Lysobacter sp. Root604]
MKGGCQHFDAALLFVDQIVCATEKVSRAIPVSHVRGHRSNQYSLHAMAHGVHGANGQQQLVAKGPELNVL